MLQRKRLLKANRKPLDSFEQDPPVIANQSNVLKCIQNQNLYLKLVGIALEMSREAGVSQPILQQVQSKLLHAKGLQQFSMLNQENNKSNNKNGAQSQQAPYNPTKKFIDKEEQLSFLNRMEKEVQQVQAKQHIIYALKKYVQEKKKLINNEPAKPQSMTRARVLMEKFKQRIGKNKIRRSNFYDQTLRQIIGRMAPSKSRAYQTFKKMSHLKTLWGHTFFSEAQQQYCPVYNVIFDNSQRLILSGGQDGKIKVWSKQTGALVTTLQGHKQYINKIVVSRNNKLILSAAQDGVRFFDLDNMSSVGGYHIESIMDIGQVVHKNSTQSSIIFANNKKLFSLPFQTIMSTKLRKLQPYDFKIYNFGSRILQNTLNTNTMTINPKGIVFLGSTEGQILIFDFHRLEHAEMDQQNFSHTKQMKKIQQFILPLICVLNAHEADILQIKWNPVLRCFSTGAKKDGVCKVWQFKGDNDSVRPFVMKQLKIPKYKMKRKKKVYNCNFGCWNSAYTHLTCSFQEQQQQQQTQNRGDGQVIVYNAMKNQITWQMSKSLDLSSIRAMDNHPFYPNIMVICDSFGKIMITDIFQNYIVNIFEQRAFHLNHPSFCLVITECRFSQDGLNLLVATQYGNISLYGYDIKDFYTVYPTEQLFQNDYQQFQIDQKTYKPIYDLQYRIDINQLVKGDLQSIRHQPYQNIPKINGIQLRKHIQHSCPKQKHVNACQYPLTEVERIGECYLQHERNMQILRQNIEEIQGKRMTILFQERQSRQLKLRQLLQEKIYKIKQVQGISFNLLSNNSFISHDSAGNISHITNMNNSTISNPNVQPQNNSQQNPRRRGRRPTRSTINTQPIHNTRIHSTAPHYTIDQSQSNNQQVHQRRNRHYNQQQQQYQAEVQQSEDQQVSDQEQQGEQDDEFNDDNQSDQVYPHTNRNRNRRNLLARRRNISNYRNGNGHVSGIVRPQRNSRRRPANIQIQQLQNDYQQYGRIKKRNNQLKQMQQQQLHNPQYNTNQHEQQRRQIRRIASRSLAQMQPKQLCQLCQTKQSTVTCCYCIIKKYCDGCRSYRGKKINQGTQYSCFQCYYLQNVSPQMYKNVSYQKYTMHLRNDLFVPQIGDQVVYFFQGYEQFLYDKIQTLNNKYKDMEIFFQLIPHQNRQQLTRIQKCTITDISYAFPLQQSSGNQLSYQQNKRGARGRLFKSNVQDILTLLTLKTVSGVQFKIFHIPGYQFILKWQIYQDIIVNDRYGKFKLFDVVRIKDQQIQIMQIRPLNPVYNKSIWKNIIVHKAQSKYLRRTRDKSDDIAINIWNIDGFIDNKAFQYKSTFTQQQKQHYKQQIQRIQSKQPRIWDIFADFVDYEQYPTYNQYVQVSMCLKLIMQRLSTNYYVCEQSFIRDVKMLQQNSALFNGKQSEVTTMAEKLVHMILQGQNYNNSNQSIANNHANPSTQKKTNRLKKRQINSSQSRQKQPEPQQEKPIKKRHEIKTSKFVGEEEQEVTNKRITRKNRLIQQSAQDYEQQQQSQEQRYSYNQNSSQVKNTRSRRRLRKQNANENANHQTHHTRNQRNQRHEGRYHQHIGNNKKEQNTSGIRVTRSRAKY